MRLRVMAWNVHGFRGGTREMAEAVRAEEPDVLLLNETGYLGFRLRRFARRLGMEGATGATLRWRIPNAVLVRTPWRSIAGQVAVLPRTRRTVRRGVVMAHLGRAGYRTWAVAVHLGLSPGEREEHAEIVLQLLEGRTPVILGGDLNEDQTGATARALARELGDAHRSSPAPTFPAREPRARIDVVFASRDVAVERAWRGGPRFAELSDHLPVVADLRLPG